MGRSVGNLSARAAVYSLGLLLLVGCDNSRSSRRQALEGTVTLDGVPLTEGTIVLLPLPGTSGPTAGGTIREGEFSISSDKGVFAGTFRVEITAEGKTGKKMMDPLVGVEIEEVVELIPVRYNHESELTATVTEGSNSQHEFALTTK